MREVELLSRRWRSRVLWFLFVASGLVVCAMAAMLAFAPIVGIAIKTADIQESGGQSYHVQLGDIRRGRFRLPENPGHDRVVSEVRLFEDGHALGPRLSSPGNVSSVGHGRYYQSADSLLFSSSDGSDPRTNAHNYHVEIRLVPPLAVLEWGAFALLVSAAALFGPRLAGSDSWLFTGSAPRPIGRQKRYRFGGSAAFALLLCGIMIALILWRWSVGPSFLFGVNGYLPVSDAFGYYRCATSVGAIPDPTFSNPPAEWCGRRIIYPYFLSGMLALTGWQPQLALLVQGALIGLAIAALGIAVRRIISPVAATIAFVGLVFYAAQFATSLFVTEVAGLTAALTGLALLLNFTGSRRFPDLAFGLAFMSLGMAARAGAIFTVPALLIWAVWAGRRTDVRRWWVMIPTLVLAGVSGPLLQFGLLHWLGIDAHNTGGNFSATLYGLATGSRDWSQAYRDFGDFFQHHSEAETFRHIYAVALEKISANPRVFLNSLWEAEVVFARSQFAFGQLAAINASLSVLLAIGVACLLGRWREPLASMLLLGVATEFLAAPLLVDSGGQRVFAATVGFRLVIAGVGASDLLAFVASGRRKLAAPLSGKEGAPRVHRLPYIVGAIWLTATLLFVTPFGRLFKLAPIAGLGCPAGQNEYVVRLNQESQSLRIGSYGIKRWQTPPSLAVDRLSADRHLGEAWYGEGFRELPEDTLVVHAFQRLPHGFGTYGYLVWYRAPQAETGDLYSLCADASQVRLIGDFNFSTVVSARRMTE